MESPMASDAKIQANRRNALRSTGPRTPEGKRRSSLNAIRHGLLAQAVVLPEEDEREFLRLRRDLWADFQPVGAMEEQLVEKIAAEMWRYQRLLLVESAIVEHSIAYRWREEEGIPALTKWGPRMAKYGAYIDRALYRALVTLKGLQRERSRGTAIQVEAEGVSEN